MYRSSPVKSREINGDEAEDKNEDGDGNPKELLADPLLTTGRPNGVYPALLFLSCLISGFVAVYLRLSPSEELLDLLPKLLGARHRV